MSAPHDHKELMEEEEVAVSDGGAARFAAVNVLSGEEEYEPIWKERAKISRFDEGENQWKERGNGDAKVLRKKSDSTRHLFVLRREGTGKLGAQHDLVDGMTIKRHPQNDKFLIWTAPKDYSDDDEGFEETFLLRCPSKDVADSFIAIFQKICNK
ncbi:Ran-binding protein, putative [Bodo saltans]|uniref:Ran-binding protein, putative n=1 Tax=Bodo saltans TaxID=75058 RepID=A0A0S4IS61_BODSA|nr:Ran-binding protein, putative [Bodo saltans]|eukprot:CUE94984.1 Ran-binding protein, putative [Bodo saltans]